MRIGLVIYGTLSTLSGGYLYDRLLVQELRRSGDQVEIISLPWSHYGRHLLHNVRPSLMNRLRSARYDLLLQDELNHPSLYRINERLRLRSTSPIITIVHHLRASEQHPPLTMPAYRRVERRYLQSVDGFIFNSETTRTAVRSLGVHPHPSIVVSPAADHRQRTLSTQQVRTRALNKRPLRLLFAGNVIPRKGVHTLIAALALLPKEDWQLSIAGDTSVDGPYTMRLKEQAERAGFGGRVTWHGRLADSDLQDLMADSDLLVVPSTYEGFGIVYLEGMSLGLPAVATTAGGAAEIIADGVNGCLVTPDDEKELALRLLPLMRDRRLLSQMSLAALTRSQEFPTWSQSLAAVRPFLLQMLS